jgi:cytochrome c2
MPYSAKALIVLLAVAALCAPISLIVQDRQNTRARTLSAAWATGGDPTAGRNAYLSYHCDACHETDPAVTVAGRVGPSLKGLSKRSEIAGHLTNQPDVLVAWIHHPQSLAPGSGMPEQGLSEKDARDIAAWLLSSK